MNSAASVVMVGPGSLLDANGVGVPDQTENQIIIDTTINDNNATGRYAWWVADEGTKARINLSRVATIPEMPKYRAVLEAANNSVADPRALVGFQTLNLKR
jgi:hypothetical protein